MIRYVRVLILALSCLSPCLALASVHHGALRRAQPGSFDYYELSMTWLPKDCFDPSGGRPDPLLCGKGRRRAFALEGLQPRYEYGAPKSCASAPPLPAHLVDEMLDLMPAADQVRREWREHGVCSGLGATAYFDRARAAFQSVRIPVAYRNPRELQRVSPSRLEQQFVYANPKLSANDIALRCDGQVLREVHVCLDRYLEPRPCSALDRDQCRADEIIVPPVP